MKKIVIVASALMFCFSSSHTLAQDCKPDVSRQDQISKQQIDYWTQTISKSDVAVTIYIGRRSFTNFVGVQIDKQEAAATSNTEFQTPFRATKGNQFYFGLKNGEPLTFVSTAVSNEAKVSGSFMAGLSGKNLYTKVVLEAVVYDKDLASLRDALTKKQIDAVRIILSGDASVQKSVSDKDSTKLMEKFSCFYQFLDKKGIDLLAPGLQPIPPSDSSIPGKYIRKDKTSDYIEIKPDGTFSLQQDGKSYVGNYNAKADTITVQVSNAPATTLRISGNTITEPDGTVWEKQSEPQKVSTEAQLTNEQIIQMVAAKLPDDVIIATIQKSKSKFDLTPDALIKLKAAGVSDAVLRAMMQ